MLYYGIFLNSDFKTTLFTHGTRNAQLHGHAIETFAGVFVGTAILRNILY